MNEKMVRSWVRKKMALRSFVGNKKSLAILPFGQDDQRRTMSVSDDGSVSLHDVRYLLKVLILIRPRKGKFRTPKVTSCD